MWIKAYGYEVASPSHEECICRVVVLRDGHAVSTVRASAGRARLEVEVPERIQYYKET